MKAVLRLAALSAWSRRLTLGLVLVAIALAVTLLLAVERLRVDARQSFTQSVSGVDLVVGFGGDGTLNEVATGIAGTDTALGVLPGGSQTYLVMDYVEGRSLSEAAGVLRVARLTR